MYRDDEDGMGFNGFGFMEDENADLPTERIMGMMKSMPRAEIKPADKSEFSVTFADVYGYENVKAALLRICDMSRDMEKYHRLGVRLPHGVMLYGEPGVGKTMMAKAMIREMDWPAYVLRKVQTDNAFLGMIGQVFEEAKKNAPSVILLDDMDKFSLSGGPTNEFAAVQAGIDSVQSSDVLVIATVNEIDKLPRALYREGRFDRKIYITLPSTEDASVIIGRYLSGKRISKDVNTTTVARLLDGYTCAALDSVLNEAGMYAGYENREEINLRDIMRAILSDVYGVDNIAVIAPEKKVNAAYHEAGHAAAAMLLKPGSVSIASVRGSGRGRDGFIQTLRSTGNSYESVCSDIKVALAGKAATEIKFSVTDMGVSMDLVKAARMCGELIRDICVKNFLPAGMGLDMRQASDSTKNSCNTQQDDMMTAFLQDVRSLLISNWGLVESIAQELISRETLICDDLDAIYTEYITAKNAAGTDIPGSMKKAS